LKLYQPAHQRYYLIAASLVCQLPGLPDRGVDPGKQERATFVIRRLIAKSGVKRPTADPSSADEYAYITDASGTGWRKLAPAAVAALAAGEEQLPLFKSQYDGDDGKKRKVLAGLVPVGRRDQYINAAPMSDPASALATGVLTPAPAPQDPRITLLQKQVTNPWRQTLAMADAAERVQASARKGSSPASLPDRETARRAAREQIQTVSWYVLLDFGKYLETYLPNVWKAITGAGSVVTAAEQSLLNALTGTVFTRNGATRTLTSALAAIRARESTLESVTTTYTEGGSGWPSELFSFATIRSSESIDGLGGAAQSPVETIYGLAPDGLETLVTRALPTTTTAPMPEAPLNTRPVLAAGDPGWFVIRCVYERPQCGPLHPTIVSEPSEVFQMAGFFDPDAPARPIRIGLPLDVSPAGLRKFDKNTAFMVSDLLCGHIQRFKGMTLGDLVLSVLPFPFHKDLPSGSSGPCSGGLMISMSIPIITLCALLLLMIIVALLNMALQWMPFFMVEIPLPGFKAKETS
jgi:hypothetical protein